MQREVLYHIMIKSQKNTPSRCCSLPSADELESLHWAGPQNPEPFVVYVLICSAREIYSTFYQHKFTKLTLSGGEIFHLAAMF